MFWLVCKPSSGMSASEHAQENKSTESVLTFVVFIVLNYANYVM